MQHWRLRWLKKSKGKPIQQEPRDSRGYTHNMPLLAPVAGLFDVQKASTLGGGVPFGDVQVG